MDTPFTFIDRAITLEFYQDPTEQVKLYLGDVLEEKIARAVAHYDEDHTLSEDVKNLRELMGQENADRLLARAEPVDRLTVLELLSYTVRRCREEQAKKLLALAED